MVAAPNKMTVESPNSAVTEISNSGYSDVRAQVHAMSLEWCGAKEWLVCARK
jgi:hypothetical protein